MNTTYDEIIDLALVTIEDYKLNMLANNIVAEDNYDLVINSGSYEEYQQYFLYFLHKSESGYTVHP